MELCDFFEMFAKNFFSQITGYAKTNFLPGFVSFYLSLAYIAIILLIFTPKYSLKFDYMINGKFVLVKKTHRKYGNCFAVIQQFKSILLI